MKMKQMIHCQNTSAQTQDSVTCNKVLKNDWEEVYVVSSIIIDVIFIASAMSKAYIILILCIEADTIRVGY